MIRTKLATLGVVAAIAVAGCGGDDSADSIDATIASGTEVGLEEEVDPDPSVPDTPTTSSVTDGEVSSVTDGEVTTSGPDELSEIGAMFECFGIDAEQLDDLDAPELSMPELEGQLGELENMSPDELAELDIEALLEELIAELDAQLGDFDDLDVTGSIPPMSMPELPFDASRFEECFGDLVPEG